MRSNRKQCPPNICQRIISRNLKSQAVSPQEFSGNHLPKSQIASSVPLRFFRESSPQISNRKQCPPNFFQKIKGPNLKSQAVYPGDFSLNHFPKSQIASSVALRIFRESDLQISNRKQCPPNICQRIISRNLKSQAVSPQEFSGNHLPKSQIASSVPLRFFRESRPQISNRKQCRPKNFQGIISPNLKSQAVSP